MIYGYLKPPYKRLLQKKGNIYAHRRRAFLQAFVFYTKYEHKNPVFARVIFKGSNRCRFCPPLTHMNCRRKWAQCPENKEKPLYMVIFVKYSVFIMNFCYLLVNGFDLLLSFSLLYISLSPKLRILKF